MSTLGEKVKKIRSKNAGPFCITIDIFCGNKQVYDDICINLDNLEIANLLMIDSQNLKNLEYIYTNVLLTKLWE